MRKFVQILVLSLFSTGAVTLSAQGWQYQSPGNAVIFVEDGITFSVFPDGEFDFFIDRPAVIGANVNFGNVNISFNSGYNYNPFVQYDDYGAVIQIENTPVYYDFYGRVTRIGNIDIFYNGNRLRRVGGLFVYYQPGGGILRFDGWVNSYSRYLPYRPYFSYFSRPAIGYCLVDYRPYRRYYEPIRYTYYRPYNHNYRRVYATVGRNYHYKPDHRRLEVYRNDRRVAQRNDRDIVSNVRSRSVDYRSDNLSRPATQSRSVNAREASRSNQTVRNSYARESVNRNATPSRNTQKAYNTDRRASTISRENQSPSKGYEVKRNSSSKTYERNSGRTTSYRNAAPVRSEVKRSEPTVRKSSSASQGRATSVKSRSSSQRGGAAVRTSSGRGNGRGQ